MGQAVGQVQKQEQRRQERHDAGIAKAQGWGALTVVGDGGLHHLFDLFLGQRTRLRDPLDVQQTPVDRPPETLELGEMSKVLADPQIGGIVDGGLGA
jgi:hypothetical protein